MQVLFGKYSRTLLSSVHFPIFSQGPQGKPFCPVKETPSDPKGARPPRGMGIKTSNFSTALNLDISLMSHEIPNREELYTALCQCDIPPLNRIFFYGYDVEDAHHVPLDIPCFSEHGPRSSGYDSSMAAVGHPDISLGLEKDPLLRGAKHI